MAVVLKPTKEIVSRLGLEENGRVQKFFTETCYKKMDKYVPKDGGNLRTVVDIKQGKITYESPYAHAQFIGFTKGPVVNYTTPGTGPYWHERLKSAEIKQIVDEVQAYLMRGG